EAHAVAQDAGVVHQDVEAAELADGLLDQALTALPGGDVVVVRRGGPARGLYLVDDLLGRALLAALSGDRRSHVVHHDGGALRRQQQGLGPADAAPRPRDHGHLAVEQSHLGSFYLVWARMRPIWRPGLRDRKT